MNVHKITKRFIRNRFSKSVEQKICNLNKELGGVRPDHLGGSRTLTNTEHKHTKYQLC